MGLLWPLFPSSSQSFLIFPYLPIQNAPLCLEDLRDQAHPPMNLSAGYVRLGVGEVNASASRLELRVPPNGSMVVEVDFRWGKSTKTSKSNAVTEPVQNLELTHAGCWFFAFMIIN